VLIPGLAANHRSWGFQLVDLKQNYRLIAIDNSGMGNSLGKIDGLSIDNMVADIDALLVSLNLTNVHLLGHSMGSMVALEYTIQYPQKVSSLILSSMPIYNSCEDTESPTERLRFFLENGDKEQFDKKIFSCLFSSNFKKSVQYRVMECLLSKNNEAKHPDVILSQLNAIKEWKELRRWEQKLIKPCMVIYGSKDTFATVDIEFLSRVFPSAIIEIINGAGHAVHIERAKEFNNIVSNFINNQTSR